MNILGLRILLNRHIVDLSILRCMKEGMNIVGLSILLCTKEGMSTVDLSIY